MDHFDSHTILSALCKSAQRWGMYVSFQYQPGTEGRLGLGIEELLKAIPYLNIEAHGQILFDGEGWFLFDSEEECQEAFDRTIGDEGPTEKNPYQGPAQAYAITCMPDGQFSNENT